MKFFLGPLLVYTDQIAAELAEKISKINAKDIEVKGKGTFDMVATTEGVDRDGEVILVSAWEYMNYQKNPVVLLSHDYRSMPIAAVTEIIPEPENKRVRVKGIFANTEQGQEARQLYEDGMLRTMSVGFIVKERNGNVITKAELLEISFVAVPSNPDALSLSRMAKFALKVFNGAEEKGGQKDDKATPIDANAALKTLSELINDLSAIHKHYSESIKPPKEKDEKSGRVLSAKNRSLVQDAITALTALLDASEPEKGTTEQALKDLLGNAQGMQKLLEGVITKAKAVKEAV